MAERLFVEHPDTGALGYYDPDTGDCGWFGSKLVKSVSHAVSSVAKTVSAPVRAASAAYSLAKNIAHGQNVLKAAKSAVGSQLPSKAQLQLAAKYAGSVPGIGTAVGAAASGVNAALSGKSLSQIAREAAIGAIPGGPLVQAATASALNVAAAGVKGQNLARAARDEAVSAAISLAPPQVQGMLHSVSAAALSGKNVITAAKAAAVAEALNQVPESARQMLKMVAQGHTDPATLLAAAPGHLIGAVAQNPASALAQTLNHPFPEGSNMRPNFSARSNIGPQFAGAAKRVFGTPSPTVVRTAPAVFRRNVPYRPVSTHAKNFLGRITGFNVAGLEADGTWTVTSGDTGEKIAKQMTGDKNRWVELKAVNPKIMSRTEGVKKYGFPIYVGDVVHLPSSWVKTQPAPAPTPAQPVPQAPQVVAPSGDVASMAAARLQLVAWGKTDGVASSGTTDYGTIQDLTATAWTSRDKFQAASFENWWNRLGFGSIPTDGEFTAQLVGTLNTWTEKKAQGAIPNLPQPQQLPPAPPPQAAPPEPAPPPPQAAPPPVPQLPSSDLQDARGRLLAWSQSTDAPAVVQTSGYGSSLDRGPTWTDRDMAVATAFEVFYNQRYGTFGPTDGALSSVLLSELRTWSGTQIRPDNQPPQAQPPQQQPPQAQPPQQQPPMPVPRQPLSATQKGAIMTGAGVIAVPLANAIAKALFGSSTPPPMPF